MLFEGTPHTLGCPDLFHHQGDVEPLTKANLSGRLRPGLEQMQVGPLANYPPYTTQTNGILYKLADLKTKTLATMHGSSYAGDGERAPRDLAVIMRDAIGD